MNQKILFITVGGSPEPIVTAIQTLNPDRVLFICSQGAKGSQSQVIGDGTPCEIRKGSEVIRRLPNIPTQVGLGDRFQSDRDLLLIQNPDDLAECYQVIASAIQQIQQEIPSAQLAADYTGGTKTMSSALVMATIDHHVQLYLTTGNRTDIIRVQRGEITEITGISPVIALRTLDQTLPPLFSQYNYPAARTQLERLLREHTLSPDLKTRVRSLIEICRGLDAWDRFDHSQAWDYLSSHMRHPEIKTLGLFLKRVMSSRQIMDEAFNPPETIPGHGYEIVQDLCLNAERRAYQQRYDDAVGRLYRALELMSQIRLKQTYGIQTGDVDLERIPEPLKSFCEQRRDPAQNKIKLALRDSYELLSQWGDDPLGSLYQTNQHQLIDILQIRNASLFAHGFEPISEHSYQRVIQILKPFFDNGISQITSTKTPASQFPQQIVF